MFTGIVEEKGIVSSFRPGPKGWVLDIRGSKVLENLELGDSIAVNGCCLTAARTGEGMISFDVLEETKRLTSFSLLRAGSGVNLERSLRFDGKVGGHFVTGHIDGLGQIEDFGPRGADYYLRIKVPDGGIRYLIHKGSIAIDGISLTVAEVSADSFSVWLIPHTLDVTNLRERRPGDAVNLEFDLLGKYVERMISLRSD